MARGSTISKFKATSKLNPLKPIDSEIRVNVLTFFLMNSMLRYYLICFKTKN